MTPVQRVRDLKSGEDTGTRTTFLFDRTIFTEEELDYRFESLVNRFRELAFVTRGVFITVRDERPEVNREMSFFFEGGLRTFVRYVNRNRNTLHDPISAQK